MNGFPSKTKEDPLRVTKVVGRGFIGNVPNPGPKTAPDEVSVYPTAQASLI